MALADTSDVRSTCRPPFTSWQTRSRMGREKYQGAEFWATSLLLVSMGILAGCILLRINGLWPSVQLNQVGALAGGVNTPMKISKEGEFFRLQWTARIQNELRLYQAGISRRSIWNTAKFLAPWTLVVHITSKRELWIPPQPGNMPNSSAQQATYMTYTLGSITAIELLLKNAELIPDVTVALLFGDNCLYLLTDSALLHRSSETFRHIPVQPSWQAWLSDDKMSPELGAVEPMSVHMAPALIYQSSVWTPTSLQCRGVTFPQYDWVWHGQDFTDGSADRKDGLGSVPWEQRKPMVVFRGSIKADSIPYSNNTEELSIRGRAALLSVQHPDLMDIKLTDPACKDPKPPNCGHPTISPDAFEASPERFMPYDAHLNYKYQIDLDGHGATFRLKHLLLSGSLVFKVDSPLSQFWATLLLPWVHYIPVSWHNLEHDLVQKLNWAKDNDAKAEKIMLAGREFANRYLTDTYVTWYQQQVLQHISNLQTPTFSMVNGSVRFCCSMIPEQYRARWKQKCERLEHSHCSTQSELDLADLLFSSTRT